MGRIIIGSIVFIIGVIFILKTEWFLRNFGRIGFFERRFGVQGGSRLGYKLIGLIIIFFGILIIVDLFGGFMGVILSPLTKYQA
ncbi:MAG: hypothetical protein ABIG10_01545 [bacterium]